jgi:hypothetical protein
MRKKYWPFVIILVLLHAGATGAFFIVKNSGIYTYYIDENLQEQWGRILEAAPPPGKYRVEVYTGDEKQLRRMKRGAVVRITTRREETSEKIKVYYALSFDLEYEGAFPLALDPWMVFQKHTDGSLTLERLRNGGRGLLLLPGGEAEARHAWAARLLQEGAGAFPEDPVLWLAVEEDLFSGNRFPADAPAVNWPNVVGRLLSNEPAWLYAPLSVIRGNASEARTSILEAVAFPENAPGGRNSLQAKLLWAIPFGAVDKQKKRLEEPIAWLKDPETQTVIADELRWIPAVPYGRPYNPVSMSSYMAWLTTVYIYELP